MHGFTCPQLSSPLQAGFRKNSSTSHLLFLLISTIQHSFSSRHSKKVPVCFLDISKAFDSVWTNGLLYKLFNAGIRGNLWRWIQNFLQARTFFIAHSNRQSDLFTIEAGVPQGCVLSPLLFLIYINDLPFEEESKTCQTTTLLFADDIALLPAQHLLHLPLRSLLAAVQRSLDAFSNWSIKWKMKFNIKKSNIVLFSRARSPPPISPLILSSQPLPSSPSYKYLGVVLDRKLRFEEHAKKIMDAVRHQSFLISRTIKPTRNPSPTTIRSLVLSKLYSTLAYSLPFWQPTAVQCRRINSSLTAPPPLH
jgi:hypothetical protein